MKYFQVLFYLIESTAVKQDACGCGCVCACVRECVLKCGMQGLRTADQLRTGKCRLVYSLYSSCTSVQPSPTKMVLTVRAEADAPAARAEGFMRRVSSFRPGVCLLHEGRR